jgi:membrane fusion protein (multidrug efflux system)
MPPTPVEVAEARPQVVRDRFRALGSVESEAIIQMVSELNATVVSLPFGEGQPVASGALIARLDDREFRADAERTQAQRDQAHSNLERAEKLFQEHAIPEQQRDDARTALRVAEANAALAAARLDKTRIRAPWPGIVGVRRVSPGAYLKSGDVITDLTQVDQMKVIFAAPERFAAQLRPGTPVELTTTAYPGVAFRGSVMAVDPVVDASTRTIRLVARIGNPGRKLRPGMSADVEVTLAERSHALVVPDEAVFAEGNQSFVYVVKSDSTVTRAAVQLGTRDSSQVEIVRGLAPGMRVVRAGHQKLYEGARVAPVPSQAEGPTAAGPGA